MIGLSVKGEKVKIDFKALVRIPFCLPCSWRNSAEYGLRRDVTLGIQITSSKLRFIFNHTPPKPVGIPSVNPPSDASVQAVNLKTDLSRKTDGRDAEAAYTSRKGPDNSGVKY